MHKYRLRQIPTVHAETFLDQSGKPAWFVKHPSGVAETLSNTEFVNRYKPVSEAGLKAVAGIPISSLGNGPVLVKPVENWTVKPVEDWTEGREL